MINSGFIYPRKEGEYEVIKGNVSEVNQYISVGEKRIPFNIFLYQVNQNYELQRNYDKDFSNEFSMEYKPSLISI